METRERVKSRLFAPIVLLVLAGALIMVEYHAARHAHAAEFERTFAPHEYASGITTEPLAGETVATRKRIRVSAPLENAWMNVTATVLRADGTVVDSGRLYIDYFLRPQRGIHWTWGLPMASALVNVPPGDHRLRLSVSLEPATAAAPPLQVQVLPAVIGSHARLAACAVSAVLGIGLLLRAMTTGSSHGRARPSSLSGIPAARVTGGNGLPSGRLHFIDGLRGIAALAVLICHLFVPAFLPGVRLIEDAIGKLLPDIMRTGALGVEIFFVLSGFVIAYSIRRHRVTPGFILRFIARRFLRLDPPYYVALFLALVVTAYAFADSLHAVLPYFQGGKGLLINALYLQDILRFRSPLGTVAWTLCLEVQFYLALVTLTGVSQWVGSAFASPAGRARSTRATWWLLFGTLGVASVVIWHTNHNNFNFIATWFRFLLGVLVFQALAARTSPWRLTGLLGVLMTVSIAFSDARGCAAAATAGLILFAGHARALDRWLDGRVWQFLGRISYSLYLYHVVLAIPFLGFIWSRLPHTLGFAVLMVPFGLVVAIACSWLMYELIERPSIGLSRRIRYHRDQPPASIAEPAAEIARCSPVS